VKKLCLQLLVAVRAMPRLHKFIVAALGGGVAGSLIGIFVAASGQASFAASVLTH
jgi:hypothetical protein